MPKCAPAVVTGFICKRVHRDMAGIAGMMYAPRSILICLFMTHLPFGYALYIGAVSCRCSIVFRYGASEVFTAFTKACHLRNMGTITDKSKHRTVTVLLTDRAIQSRTLRKNINTLHGFSF